jgi:hypothetical protein
VGAGEAGALALVEATVKYHPGGALALTPGSAASRRTATGGEFDWGGRLPKSNGGAQWFPQAGWQSAGARKGSKGA